MPRRSTWDTEVFVFRGDDRAHLRKQLLARADRPVADLPAQAAELARALEPGGSRLAIVAGSAGDLAAKLRRAAERLADPACQHIRDAAGVYYFSAPLFAQGTLALLFPGEGAQYPNMLADLCGVFPEVEDAFAWCDKVAAEAGRPSLRRVLHVPPGASADEKAAAEAELRKLGPSIFGVLVADLAVIRLLHNLRLPVSAVAGHSAGELAALLASGAMRSEEALGGRLAEIMDVMQRQEDAAGGPEVALLAVGAGRAAVEEAAAAVAGGAVVVAMDNCPHQCVAVGPAHLVAAVEAVLVERGLVCERLPFRRPYHTALFEPWMGPFRDLFAGVPFEAPHTPVYSCSTGKRFPDDPAAIRELAVNHWVSPVAFSGMIETMYADGVRLFVEAGPRGNLSAFVEDILRGRPFAAIPANVPRKSGPTQLNHLVAQLVAHHVPLNLGHLFGERVDEDNLTPQPPFPKREGGLFSPPFLGEGPGEGLSSDVLHAYLGAMEQFLDVQREVMEAYLAGRAAVPAVEEPLPSFALVGEIVHHVPGSEVTVRRVMDLNEDRYADDHTLGGRGVSRVDPGQNGLPVLPMTFSLEAMAEAAALVAPGKVVAAVRNVRLHRWLPFDPEPTTLEVRAAVASVDPETGTVEVRADVRDLGNSFVKDGADKPASEAVLVLADRYPEPPAAMPFGLSNERPCQSTVEDLRRNIFHGPTFQMIRSLGRIGTEGIEGTLEVQPRTGWFRSNPEPRVVLDPVLMDAAMHLLGAWHLEQPDWTGRILLPFEVGRVEFFGPAPAAGSTLIVRGHNEQESARHVRHGLEVFDPAGRVWLRMTGAGYWRFYLPFGNTNFFGPKDQYFLSWDWPEAFSNAECGMRNVELNSEFRIPNSAFACCRFLEPPADLKHPVLRAAGARVTMTPRELVEFGGWTGTDAGLNDWFFGRLTAKDAVRAAWAEKHGERIFPADIAIKVEGGRYVARPRGATGPEPLPPVAVAIAGGAAAAFAAFAETVGIGLMKLTPGQDEAEGRVLAAKLAVADALRVAADAVTAGPADAAGLVVAGTGRRFRVQTARHKDWVVATTLCEAAT